jgi:hypothetical protein
MANIDSIIRKLKSNSLPLLLDSFADVATFANATRNTFSLITQALEAAGTGSGFGPSQSLSTTFSAATAIPAAGGTQSFELGLPGSFVEIQTLELDVTNDTPGPGISSIDIALYETAANRAAGTFSPSDAGIQFLATAISSAALGPATYTAGVLGVMQGSNSTLYGLIRNNDATSTFDATIAVEAYSRIGERAS